MKRFFIILLTALLLGISTQSIASDISYKHKITVDKITFQWALEADVIHIKLSAKTSGWVGVGFNPTKKMKDANFITGYVKNGKVFVKDQFGISENKHEGDVKSGGSDNVTNISGKESGGFTEITFTIPLDSGDTYDQTIKPEGETVLLLAYAPGLDSFFTKHRFRTHLSVNLSTGSYKEIKHNH